MLNITDRSGFQRAIRPYVVLRGFDHSSWRYEVLKLKLRSDDLSGIPGNITNKNSLNISAGHRHCMQLHKGCEGHISLAVEWYLPRYDLVLLTMGSPTFSYVGIVRIWRKLFAKRVQPLCLYSVFYGRVSIMMMWPWHRRPPPTAPAAVRRQDDDVQDDDGTSII